MYLKKSASVFILSVTVLCSSFPQKIFRPGYIVKNDDRQLYGLLEFKPGNRIPSECVFKSFEIAAGITYRPDKIKAFGYHNGKRFESLDIENRKTFYETLVKGELSLYRQGQKYFIQKGDAKPVEIKSGLNIMVENNNRLEFKNASELLKHITGFDEIKEKPDFDKDLIELVVSYNSRKGAAYAVYGREITKREITAVTAFSDVRRSSPGFISGVSYYNLEVHKKSRFNSSFFITGPTTGQDLFYSVTYERLISRRTDRLLVRTDPAYLKQNFYFYTENNLPGDKISRDDVFFEFKALKIPLMLQYSFKGFRISPYFNAGASVMFLVKGKYKHYNEVEDSNHTVYISEDQQMKFKSNELSVLVGTGAKIRLADKISLRIEGRLEAGTGIFDNNFPTFNGLTQYSLQPMVLFGFVF